MKNKNAYTLIEIIVTLAILGIVLAMALPNIGYFKAIREAQEIKELKRDILFARNKAILDGKEYGIQIRKDDNSYIVHRGLEIIKIKHFEHGTKISNRGGAPKILFKANGTTVVQGSIYFLNRLEEEYQLTISLIACKIDIKKTYKWILGENLWKEMGLYL